jgi:ABC-type antimicrobial peptide transport system permease subunit
VVSRTNEIGIRMALGAAPRRILAMITGEALVLLGFGLASGLALTMIVGTTVSKLIYGLTPRDPFTLAAAALGFAVVAIGASLLPAQRAARLDPMVALRDE